MADPRFASAERRSMVAPALLALAALIAALFVARHFFPATSVEIAHVKTELLPTSTVYHAETIVVGPAHTETVLFVAETARIENRLRVPISLDDWSMVLRDPSGAELLSKGVTRDELASLEQSFPKLRRLMDNPLRRDVSLEPGQSVTGTMLFSFAVPESVWTGRKEAVLRVDPYHVPALYQTVPKE